MIFLMGLPMARILLNCDIGESFGAWTMGLDAQVMPYIDCANIACGFHASDPVTMQRTVALALEHNVRIGAHPGYPDLVGFGRRSMSCSNEEIKAMLLYQIGALDGICRAQGSALSYVKPHGALYNDMMRQPALLRAVLEAVHSYNPQLPLMLMSVKDNQPATELAAQVGVELYFEVFADRSYDPEGRLLARDLPNAVHHNAEVICAQALRLTQGQALVASDGSALQLQADTLCVHGDNASSVAAVQRIREALSA